MPGSGKTTLGKQLASVFGIQFIDLDHEIERSEGRTIKEIFSDKGEDYFRKAESRELHRHATSPDKFVMSTGGGAPCFLDGITVINKTGLSIFLDVPVRELIRRLEKDKDRPLLQDADLEHKLSSLRQIRSEIYRQAQIVISGESISVKEIMDMLKATEM